MNFFSRFSKDGCHDALVELGINSVYNTAIHAVLSAPTDVYGEVSDTLCDWVEQVFDKVYMDYCNKYIIGRRNARIIIDKMIYSFWDEVEANRQIVIV